MMASALAAMVFFGTYSGRRKPSDKSGKRTAIQTAAQPDAKKPASNMLSDLQFRVKSANIRVDLITLIAAADVCYREPADFADRLVVSTLFPHLWLIFQ